MKKRGTLLILSGPSGVGKGTVVKELRRRSDRVWLSVSATTRKPRPEDKDGVTYWFKTKEEFQDMIAKDQFLEHACYSGNYYGTPEGPVNEMLAAGKDVVLEIEVQGALQVMQRRPDAVSVFIAAPVFSQIRQRLLHRGDTTGDDLESRVTTARWEYSQAPKYDFIVVNDCVENCADEIMAILAADKCKAKYRTELLKEDD